MSIKREHINKDIPVRQHCVCSYAKGNFPWGDRGIFHWASYCSAELDPLPEYLRRHVYANATWGSRQAYQSFSNTPNARQKSDSIWQHVHILSWVTRISIPLLYLPRLCPRSVLSNQCTYWGQPCFANTWAEESQSYCHSSHCGSQIGFPGRRKSV